jgi:TetR/AcrR family fatty acid metabolism transcriptional regulator
MKKVLLTHLRSDIFTGINLTRYWARSFRNCNPHGIPPCLSEKNGHSRIQEHKGTEMNKKSTDTTKTNNRKPNKPYPPGRIKIAKAMRSLLAHKDFNAITTAEIARESGMNEALIYRYFKDKRGLLHQVLADDLEGFNKQILMDINGVEGALNKLRKLIWSQINYYDQNRIPAKILLLEVRSYKGYFKSETYRMVRDYARVVTEIINEGIENGEIREDISPKHLRRIVIGGIEYMLLGAITHQTPIDVNSVQEDLCKIIFDGIAKKHG